MDEEREVQRRLDAMFASARPRPGFEDELWARIEARRPWHVRLRGWFAVPGHLAPALAAVLVVAIGGGWLLTGFHPAGGPATTSSSGAGSAFAPAQGRPAFGALPLPAGVRAPSDAQKSNGSAPAAADSSTFAGFLPDVPPTLPVYRYDDPTADQLNMQLAGLKARSGLPLTVTPSDPTSGREPGYGASGLAAPTNGGNPLIAGTAFLADHGLLPFFSYLPAETSDELILVRTFGGPAWNFRQVDVRGATVGTTLWFSGGAIDRVSGPLQLPLGTADYPTQPAAAALAAAGISDRRTPLGTTPVAAGYTFGEVVYILAVAGGNGYYEPALLISGPAGARVLPLLAPQWQGR